MDQHTPEGLLIKASTTGYNLYIMNKHQLTNQLPINQSINQYQSTCPLKKMMDDGFKCV